MRGNKSLQTQHSRSKLELTFSLYYSDLGRWHLVAPWQQCHWKKKKSALAIIRPFLDFFTDTFTQYQNVSLKLCKYHIFLFLPFQR